MKRIACRMSACAVPSIVVALLFVLNSDQSNAAPVQPSLPDSGWLLDEGTGTALYEYGGPRSGDIGGPTLPTWSTNTPFSYTDNHSIDFAPSGSSLGNYARLDGGDSPASGTLSLWVTDDGASSTKYMFDTDGSRTLMYRSGSNSFGYYQNGAYVGGVTGTVVPTDGTWTHVAVVWDNAHATEKQKVYKNGALFQTFNTSFNPATNQVNTYLGSRHSLNEAWDGKIDEYARWNTPLSDDEVEWLAGNSLHDIPLPASSLPPMPDDAWLFDRGTGSIARSFVEGGGDGTLHSNVGWTTDVPLAYEGNHALVFDGTSDNRVNFAGRTSGTEGTISLWAYRESGAMYLFDSSNGARTLLYGHFSWYLNNQSMPGLSGDLMPDNRWTLLTITWDNSLDSEKQKVYKNGSLFASFDRTISTSSPAMLWLGSRHSNNESWKGMIDEYAFWDQALDPDQVRWLYSHSLSELPEPGTLTLLALGMIGMGLFGRRRGK